MKNKKIPIIDADSNKCGNCIHFESNHLSHGIGCALHGYLVGKTWSCDKFYKTPNEYYNYMRTNIKNGG